MRVGFLEGLFRKEDPRYSGMVSKMKQGNLITRAIPEYWYSDRRYPEVALATGFKVAKIAREKEKYPSLNEKNVPGGVERKFDKDGTPNVLMLEVKKGWAAVSIEKPASEKDFSLFWKALEDPLRYIKKV